jgi:pilus assembly protein CpaB
MGSSMTTRTKAALFVGLIVFVVGGGGAAYVATRDPGSSVATTPGVDVLYTKAPIKAGTAGSTVLTSGAVASKQLPKANVPVGAVTSPAEISSGVAIEDIPAGALVTVDMFPAPQTKIGTVVIPPGKRALSLELEAVPGVSGFVGAGDHIDVYRVATAEGVPPGVKLLLQGVEVLNVNGTPLLSVQGQPKSPNLVYLLAVSPADAERLIYLSEFEKMYFDLVPKDEPAVETPGAGSGPTLQAT